MADAFYSSLDAVTDEQSFYNVLRHTGRGMTEFWMSINEGLPFEGNPKDGHLWYQSPEPSTGEDNKHLEGSKRADVEKYTDVQLINHLQILKRTYGITGSEAEAKSRIKDAKDRHLKLQRRKSLAQLRLDVERALLKNTPPVQRTATVEGEMGGLRHYITEVIDGAGTAALDYDAHIDEPLKTMWEAGVLEDKVILCGTMVKKKIAKLVETYRRYERTASGIYHDVKRIDEAGWASNVDVRPSTFLADNEMIIYAPELIHTVLLRQVKDRECTDPEYDAEAYENLFEMTLQVDDPYAAIWVHSLDVA